MPPTSPTASDYFGAMVASYDSLIRRAVPRYDEMTDRLVAYLPTHATRILELGCGTGNLTLRLAAKYPNAEITTVDASAEMTSVTQARFQSKYAGAITRRNSQSHTATSSPRRSDALVSPVHTITTRFEDLSFAPGSFDLVTSCMSLHHVKDKAPLYRNIATWLTPGGTLAIADQLLGATPEIQQSYWNDWLAFCRLPGHCTEEEIKSLIDHANVHDHYEPLAAHTQYLTAAGFTHPDCAWRNLMYSVIHTTR